ncbi:hypothetical protein Pmani_021641 [Petrolisthes manimaculis]|uniref:THAP-type domain-containing protein n=1 Tax=Petrolisthes manimaculis TaxID=1843537 RepID=A0AAE1PED8_9EUCA|nr:hypothetical protein Pmani_021641 [Petrolisthes manimaculis]
MEGRTHVCLICGNAKSTHPDFVYHRFPKENQRCNLWKSIVSIPRITEMTVEKLRRNYQICSRHFSPKHYMTGHFKSKLMHDAYPDQNLQSTGAAVLTKDSVVENSGYPGIEYQPRPHDGTLQAECAEVVDPEFGSLDVDSLRNLAGQTSPVMTESGENREVNRRGEPCITYPVRHTAETPVRHTAETPVRHTAETPARHTAGTPARLGHPKITSSHIHDSKNLQQCRLHIRKLLAEINLLKKGLHEEHIDHGSGSTGDCSLGEYFASFNPYSTGTTTTHASSLERYLGLLGVMT